VYNVISVSIITLGKHSNKHIRETLELARQLTILADAGEADAQDDGCCALYAAVRDCAYRIRSEAERERAEHKANGTWDEPSRHAVVR